MLSRCVTASHWPGRVTNCSRSSVNTGSCVQAQLLVCSSAGAGRSRYLCRYICVDISIYLHCLCSRPGGCRQSAASSASVTTTPGKLHLSSDTTWTREQGNCWQWPGLMGVLVQQLLWKPAAIIWLNLLPCLDASHFLPHQLISTEVRVNFHRNKLSTEHTMRWEAHYPAPPPWKGRGSDGGSTKGRCSHGGRSVVTGYGPIVT